MEKDDDVIILEPGQTFNLEFNLKFSISNYIRINKFDLECFIHEAVSSYIYSLSAVEDR